jgi:hypothetical protein
MFGARRLNLSQTRPRVVQYTAMRFGVAKQQRICVLGGGVLAVISSPLYCMLISYRLGSSSNLLDTFWHTASNKLLFHKKNKPVVKRKYRHSIDHGVVVVLPCAMFDSPRYDHLIGNDGDGEMSTALSMTERQYVRSLAERDTSILGSALA